MQDLRGLEVGPCSAGEAEERGVYKTPPLFVRKNIMRNKPCGCGSGKKFKKCCWNKFNGVSI